MVAMKIYTYGNPVLRTKAQPITEITQEVRQLAHDMAAWVRTHNALGLAAPQVGYSWRLFVASFPTYTKDGHMKASNEVIVFINPILSEPSKQLWTRSEACFSLPGIQVNVERPWAIHVAATDLEGRLFEHTLNGLPARIVMHENDHINGVLMIDRLDKQARKRIANDLNRMTKKHS
jgi:peptide deformylase